MRITNIVPGAVFTSMWGPDGVALKDRMMQPKDIPNTVLFALTTPERTSVEEIRAHPVQGDI